MTRRSTPQRTIDDRAFPIRIKIAVPPRGLGKQLLDMQVWLQEEIGRGEFAIHPALMAGVVDAAGFHFRSLAAAARFLDAFPTVELADAVGAPTYTSPSAPPAR